MRVFAYAREALDAIWRNRTRSILTMLGMIIGTSSVIAVLGISHAASSGIAAQISSFGAPPVAISVDQTQDNPQAAKMEYRDVASVSDATQSLAMHIEPTYQQNFEVRANGVHGYVTTVSGSGYHPDALTMRSGRRLTDDDVNSGAHVLTMGPDTADRYFKNREAVGQFVDVGGVRFEVIGVYDPLKGSLFQQGSTDYIEIPYSTFHRLAPGPLQGLQFYAVDPAQTDAATAAVIAALQHVHGRRAKYTSQNGAAFISGFENVINIIAAGLTAIGGVALVVAGIGIMNIMLVSVTERTREIGIRKAIGASRRDIATQFLMEALLLALGGGATGMFLGILATIGMASLISRTLGQAIIPYLLVVSVALGFSITVGMVFGTYPALRAARMDPIEALRS